MMVTKIQQPLPQIRVQGHLFPIPPPTIGLPLSCPAFLHSVNQILRIAMNRNATSLSQGLEASNCRENLHPVVRRPPESPRRFPPAAFVDENNAIAARARITNTGTVRVNRDMLEIGQSYTPVSHACCRQAGPRAHRRAAAAHALRLHRHFKTCHSDPPKAEKNLAVGRRRSTYPPHSPRFFVASLLRMTATYTPVSRARERIVGPPLLIRFVCIGCPFPQFGMASSRKSSPTASTFRK